MVEVLAKELSREDAINAAYFHGSAAGAGLRPESDVDVAVLPFAAAALSQSATLDLVGRLSLALGRDVDLCVLSTSNLVYARDVAEQV